MEFFEFRGFSEHFLGYVELPSKPLWIPTEYQHVTAKNQWHLPWYLYRRRYQLVLEDSITQGRNMNVLYGCVQEVGCSNPSSFKRWLTGMKYVRKHTVDCPQHETSLEGAGAKHLWKYPIPLLARSFGLYNRQKNGHSPYWSSQSHRSCHPPCFEKIFLYLFSNNVIRINIPVN